MYCPYRNETFEPRNLSEDLALAYGWALGEHANTALALEAWEMAKATFRSHSNEYWWYA